MTGLVGAMTPEAPYSTIAGAASVRFHALDAARLAPALFLPAGRVLAVASKLDRLPFLLAVFAAVFPVRRVLGHHTFARGMCALGLVSHRRPPCLDEILTPWGRVAPDMAVSGSRLTRISDLVVVLSLAEQLSVLDFCGFR
jgi:hypothetical protein